MMEAIPPDEPVVISPEDRAEAIRNGPKTGVVVGTFSALPYVHLQLEAWRQFYPEAACLIHDDCSAERGAIEALAKSYGAEFMTSPVRHIHHLGDLTVYPKGLEWAQRRGIEVLLKVSRRWIWKTDWRPSAFALIKDSGNPTLSHFTSSFAFGFRTESVVFDVNVWAGGPFIEEAMRRVWGPDHVFVENYIHTWAIMLGDDPGSERWQEYKKTNPIREERRGYPPWTLLGRSRCEKSETHLWHDANPPEDYAALATEWGLPYTAEDFRDPNGGQGNGRPK